MFSERTKVQIKGYLEGFVQGLIHDFKQNKDAPEPALAFSRRNSSATLKPFHEAMLPVGIRRISAFERSFSTRLGNTFEGCAFLIAQEVHVTAKRGLRIPSIDIPGAAAAKIEELIAENNRSGLPKPFPDQIKEVLSALHGPTVRRPAIADLYFKKADNTEWFFEIKSPEPNKGQCLEVTQRLLTIHTIQSWQRKSANTYFAMAYNPYIDRASYKWAYAMKHLDMDNQVLLQEEFWTIVGDHHSTYNALLDIYREVGEQKGKDMIDQLGFDF